MKSRLKTAATLSSLIVVLVYTSVSYPRSPPPPPYNPQVTYFAGTGAAARTITVSNVDGSDVVPLYSTKNIVSGLKFASTGNRIVFTEQNAIKVLTYAVSSSGVATTSVTTLTNEPFQPLRVDVSPDGTELLFTEKTATPGQYAVHVMSMSGGAPTLIPLAPDCYFDAVWAQSNSVIAVIQGAPHDQASGIPQTIQVIDLDPANNYSPSPPQIVFTTTVSQLYLITRIESAHQSAELVFSATANSSIGIYTLDIGTTALTPVLAGGNPSFSADDSTILFVAPVGTANLFTFNRTTNIETQITSKVLLGSPDILP